MNKVKDKLIVYNLNGDKKGELEISSELLNIKTNEALIHQVVNVYLGNQRKANASTKKRGEVRGGGKKPWRQKGTGRARAGSIRSPLWQGGGVVFGPTKEKNYKRKITKSLRNKFLSMILSDKIKSNEVIILEKIEIKEPKTKILENFLNKFSFKNSLLILLPDINDVIQRAAKNIPYLKVENLKSFNPMNLLNYKYLMTTPEVMKELEEKVKNN